MPKPYQIIPPGSLRRPKIYTVVNDNSEVVTNPAIGGGNITSCLCVFSSPKGRDREVITIKNGQAEFLEEFGLGSFSQYGQPLLNAYAAATAATTSNAMVHCIRVTPDDAAYSTATLICKYKVVESVLHLRFVTKPSDRNITDLDELDTACTVNPVADEEGFTPVKMLTIAYRGRGIYGQNIRFRITTDKASDKNNDYKNYNFFVYRNESVLEQVEGFSGVIVPDTVISGLNMYLEEMINSETNGSNVVRIEMFPDAFEKIFSVYKTQVDTTTTYTINDFDPILGIDKYTRNAIDKLVIEPAAGFTPGTGEIAVDVSSSEGVALLGGSDGSLASTIRPEARQATLNSLYLQAFNQTMDPNIKSRYRFPTTFIYDANYDMRTKLAIVQLVTARTDCVGILDFGLDIHTKASVYAYFNENFKSIVDSPDIYYEAYAMKVRDPYSKKTISVTSTYWMIAAYLTHINAYNGKHKPMAGNNLGIITGYIGNSVYPVFDDTLDEEMMDELADGNVNIAKYNQRQMVVRAMQNSSQSKLSSLTEMNNVLVLKDVKRDCELLCTYYEYEFSEDDDIARFNADVANITARYSDQVRTINAYFDKSDWEAERSIIHLYVEMVFKDLVKTSIIEIDVNRGE